MSIFLKDDNVILRKLAADADLSEYLEFINDAENLTWMEGVGNKPLSREDLVAHINNDSNFLLGIFSHSGQHVGNIQLTAISHHHRNAKFGIVLSRKAQGKGYARSASRLVLKHAFEVLNLHRVYLNVVEANIAGVELYRRLGFIEEGRHKEAHLVQFKFHDCICFYMLEEHYKKLREAEA